MITRRSKGNALEGGNDPLFAADCAHSSEHDLKRRSALPPPGPRKLWASARSSPPVLLQAQSWCQAPNMKLGAMLPLPGRSNLHRGVDDRLW